MQIHNKTASRRTFAGKKSLHWFTDRSRTNDRVGSGVAEMRPSFIVSFNVYQHATVFQAEILAIAIK